MTVCSSRCAITKKKYTDGESECVWFVMPKERDKATYKMYRKHEGFITFTTKIKFAKDEWQITYTHKPSEVPFVAFLCSQQQRIHIILVSSDLSMVLLLLLLLLVLTIQMVTTAIIYLLILQMKHNVNATKAKVNANRVKKR